MSAVLQFLGFCWALPWTLLGASIGVLGLTSGGRGRRVGWICEFHGGLVSRLLQRMPHAPIALTLGHVVLGATADALEIARRHELVHVRQYNRWGPFFVPAYLLCSLALWLRGRDAYRENPFEREAYACEPIA